MQVPRTLMGGPLALKDYSLIIDRSGSMSTQDMNGQTRWQAAAETTEALARKVGPYDSDGLDVWLFANTHRHFKVNAEKVKQIWSENEPCGGTAMAEVLDSAIKNYFQRRQNGTLKPNGEMMFVISCCGPAPRTLDLSNCSYACHNLSVVRL